MEVSTILVFWNCMLSLSIMRRALACLMKATTPIPTEALQKMSSCHLGRFMAVLMPTFEVE